MIPSRQDAYSLIERRGMPGHIVRHSEMVTRVAMNVAASLVDAGVAENLALVEVGGLLHDICKMDSIAGRGDHAALGRELLDELGWEEVGDIVAQHVRLDSSDLNEAMLVYYADKRVMHDTVVSLDMRFDDLMVRYGKTEESRQRIRAHHVQAAEVERLIVKRSGLVPETLLALNLVAGNDALDAHHGLGRQDGAVEGQHQAVELERIDENQLSLIDE